MIIKNIIIFSRSLIIIHSFIHLFVLLIYTNDMIIATNTRVIYAVPDPVLLVGAYILLLALLLLDDDVLSHFRHGSSTA